MSPKLGDSTHPKPGPTVGEIIKDVQEAINEANTDLKVSETNPWYLKTVKVSLQTVWDTKDSLEVDYLLVALKGYEESSRTKELDVTLVPQAVEIRAIGLDAKVIEQLRDSIISIHKNIQKVYSAPKNSNGVTLATSEVGIQMILAVTWDGSAGVNKWVLSPISVSGSAEISRKTTHTITLTFSPDPPKP
jgi:hypothetical protein